MNKKPELFLRRAFTLIELLVVIGILGILATFVLSAIGGAKINAQKAIAKSQIKSLATALEAYNTDVGYYPREKGNVPGADLPHLLFAALNNKPTVKLGGGPNAPYYDAEKKNIGFLTNDSGQYPYQIYTAAGLAGQRQGGTAGEVAFFNTEPLSENDNPASATFQGKKSYTGTTGPEILNNSLNGFPAYTDPWSGAYHYREWQSKPEQEKESRSTQAFDKRANNFNTFDIWSNGPDGVNQFGHPDSDDVSNWGK
jgi:prepilin-type N-terminal cleavage/methylation domain-containing protein